MKIYVLDIHTYIYSPVGEGEPVTVPVAFLLANFVVHTNLNLTGRDLLKRGPLVLKLEEAFAVGAGEIILTEEEFNVVKGVRDSLSIGWDRPLLEMAQRIEECLPQEAELKLAKE